MLFYQVLATILKILVELLDKRLLSLGLYLGGIKKSAICYEIA